MALQDVPSSIRYLPKVLSPPFSTHDSVPVVELEESLLEENHQNLQHSLISQCLNRVVSAKVLAERLPTIWCIQGSLGVLELHKGFLPFTFSNVADLCKARDGSPWIAAGEPIVVTTWVPNFDPQLAYLGAAPLWVRLLGLPLELWIEPIYGRL